MKTKHTFYFLLILGAAILMASGDRVLRKELAFSIGMVLLMFGIYKTSQSIGSGKNRKAEEEDQP